MTAFWVACGVIAVAWALTEITHYFQERTA